MRLRKPRASRRVDRGRTKRPDARPPLRFRLEAAQALRRLAGWVGRVQNVVMTSSRWPDDQGIRPYDHAMFYFRGARSIENAACKSTARRRKVHRVRGSLPLNMIDANRADAAIQFRKNEIRVRVLFEHSKLARILVGWAF
jgi:hypothetical protein